MNLFKIVRRQQLSASLEDVWAFFSNPANLAAITPPELGFVTTSQQVKPHIYPGQVITYTITPFAGIKMNWMTEITHVDGHHLFVDEQRKGPYKLWHHQHHFEPNDNGVLMTDIVHYSLPLGPLGLLAHAWFVKKQLNHIFDYRFQKTEMLFNKK